jgi:hypothetical protein
MDALSLTPVDLSLALGAALVMGGWGGYRLHGWLVRREQRRRTRAREAGRSDRGPRGAALANLLARPSPGQERAGNRAVRHSGGGSTPAVMATQPPYQHHAAAPEPFHSGHGPPALIADDRLEPQRHGRGVRGVPAQAL